MTKTILAAALLALSTTAHADPQATYKEIETAMGFVPSFVRALPEPLVGAWWDGVKTLEMNPKSALDGKTKELIGLAVAAQIPCEYCIYFHTKLAKANGATDAQIAEAVGMASLTRMGSTLLNGLQIDHDGFRRDVDRALAPKGGRK
jgi:AhpD family alkylhydroperoxidase